MDDYIEFACHDLGQDCRFYTGRLPAAMLLTDPEFQSLWDEHPKEYHQIKMHGRLVATPRWQQAYGSDYHYTGRVNRALPMLPVLEPILSWCRIHIDEGLNGILLNWYDAAFRHYIGKHRDSRKNMTVGAPIVTISFGATRVFRIRPWKAGGYRDFTASDGDVFITPYETNLAFTHEVPHHAGSTGRRISVTVRAFEL